MRKILFLLIFNNIYFSFDLGTSIGLRFFASYNFLVIFLYLSGLSAMNSSHYHVGEERKEAWSAWID